MISFLFTTSVMADVMNLNEFMPTRLEDASPTDEGRAEFQLSSEFEEKRQDELTLRANARYGYSDRLQLEGLVNTLSGGEEKHSGDSQIGGQYLINRAEKYIPEFAISPSLVLPTGKDSRGLKGHVRMNVSSTLVGSSTTPTTQIHFNVDLGHDRLYVIGLSHRYSDSGSLIIDLYREEEVSIEEESNIFEVGTEYDLGSHWYAGVGGGIGSGGQSPSWEGIFSLEKQL